MYWIVTMPKPPPPTKLNKLDLQAVHILVELQELKVRALKSDDEGDMPPDLEEFPTKEDRDGVAALKYTQSCLAVSRELPGASKYSAWGQHQKFWTAEQVKQLQNLMKTEQDLESIASKMQTVRPNVSGSQISAKIRAMKFQARYAAKAAAQASGGAAP